MEQPEILFQDNVLIVISKPSGLIVNRSDTTIHEKTLQDWIEGQNILSISGEVNQTSGFLNRSGIVHRLDKETSGIILVAKNAETFSELQRQFKERIVEKTYIALTHGEVLPPEGEINVPVGRLVYNRKRFGIVAGGRESLTQYTTLNKYYLKKLNQIELLTLLELYPKTGRTHQIRVHLKYIGHPIFGDELYAGRKTSRADRKLLHRFFLHAAKISFIHPITHKTVHFESKLPDDLQKLLDNLIQLNFV